MLNEMEKLRDLAAKLETHLEMVRLKQGQNQEITFDDTAASKAKEISKEIEVHLHEAEEHSKLMEQFGFSETVPVRRDESSRDEAPKPTREVSQGKK